MAHLGALLAALAALAVAPVQAASFAGGAVNNFTTTLFDLRPSDGIMPAVTFSTPYFGDSASVFVQDNGNTRSSSASGTGPFDLDVGTALTLARAGVSGTGPTDLGQLRATGFALDPLAPGDFTFYSATAGAPSFPIDFTVTPGTLVSFSALATVNATTTIGSTAFGAESAGAILGSVRQ